MKFHTQTRFGAPDGNCFATCVASLFGLPADAVPHFMHLGVGDDWYDAFVEWCGKFNVRPLELHASPEELELGSVACIASGMASRGLMHAVLWRDGKCLHDPHPSREGLSERPTHYMYFLPIDPSKRVFDEFNREARERLGRTPTLRLARWLRRL